MRDRAGSQTMVTWPNGASKCLEENKMQIRARFLTWGSSLILMMAMAGTALAVTTITFQDGDFVDANWSMTFEIINAGGSVNAFQVGTGGNPAAFRRIENSKNSAIGTGVANSVYGFHHLVGADHDPAADGAVLSVAYSEDSLQILDGVQACGVALRQGGVVYYGPGFLSPAQIGVWATTVQSGLVASQFDALPPGIQNPDFSESGGPMEWGFFRANSTGVGSGGGTTVGGIDNWEVILTIDAIVPTATSAWGDVKAMFRTGNDLR